MFHLDDEPAELVNMTVYSELHGDERESGIAFKLSVTQANDVLDQHHPGLRLAFYRAADVISAQKKLDAVPVATPVRRFPEITSIDWNQSVVGAKLTMRHDDLLGSEPVECSEVTVDNFEIIFLDAAVTRNFRVKCKPVADDVGHAYEWLRKTVHITIVPPEAARYEPPPADLVTEAEKPKRGRKKAFAAALDGTGETQPFEAGVGA